MRENINTILEELHQGRVLEDYPWMTPEENKELNAIEEYDLKTPVNKWDHFALVRVGRSHDKFDTLEGLKKALEYKGLPLSLANFNIRNLDKENGYIKNNYQGYSTFAYPPTNPKWDKMYDEIASKHR